jgi:DNA-binding GntR family transcriptional regulator
MKQGNVSQATEAFQYLKKKIIDGDLRPNQRLVESDIAGELGVSRTPVREAFKELLIKGYLTALSSGGMVVSELSPTKIIEMNEIREALETKAIVLACERITGEELKKADEFHAKCLEAISDEDFESFAELNQSFHNVLISGCHNDRLYSLIDSIRDQYLDRQITRSFTTRQWKTIGRQHQRLLDAVRNGDALKAKKAVLDHLELFVKGAMRQHI